MSGAIFQGKIDALLSRLASTFGDGAFTVTLLEPAAQTENPWDAPAGAPTEHNVKAVIDDYPQSLIDGTLIQTGDKRISLSAIGIVPSVNWKVISLGKTYRIVSVKEIVPVGTVLLVEIQARV